MEAGDLEKVRFLAHSLKGASATLGMGRVSAACKAMEMHAKDGESAGLPQAYELVAREMQTVFETIRSLPLFNEN